MVNINEMAQAYIKSVELDIQKISEQIESLQSNLNAAFAHLDECKEALVESNSISKIYARPTAITIGFVAATYYTAEDEAANSEHVEGTLKTPRQGTNYPKNIFELWTEAELKAIGIYSITIDNSNLKDEQYYQNQTVLKLRTI